MALVSVKQAAVSELFSDPFEFRDRPTDFYVPLLDSVFLGICQSQLEPWYYCNGD